MSVHSRASLDYLFHHVFLPPKLPHEDDSGNDGVLCDAVSEALESFLGFAAGDDAVALTDLRDMMRRTRRAHDSSMGHILEAELREALHALPSQGLVSPASFFAIDYQSDSITGGMLALHVAAQNAAVLVSLTDDGPERSPCFECFELSPPNAVIVGVRGRLQRSFPGCAIRVDREVGVDPDFTQSLAHTVALMSHQAVAGQRPQVKKAGGWHDEDRDTTRPGVVTEYLRGLLTGLGEPVDVRAVSKHCREEVMYRDGRAPWRRSPVWLLVRVSLQRGLARLEKVLRISPDLYKHFMVYLMAQILRRATDGRLPSETLHMMQAKVARRLCKLTGPYHEDLSGEVSEILRAAESTIADRWQVIQQQHTGRDVRLRQLAQLRFDEDTFLRLPELDALIADIGKRETHDCTSEFVPRMDLISLRPDALPELLFVGHDPDVIVPNLHGFETWVADHLSTWTTSHATDADAGCQLAVLLQRYHAIAEPHYEDNPEALSIMLLVVMELWVACDRLVLGVCPLLGEYVPGVPREPLQNLLLPRSGHLSRLRSVEEYLEKRAHASRPSSALFTAVHDILCFSNQFFEQSPEHQRVHTAILDAAQRDRDEKRQELKRLKFEYRRLQELDDRTECEYRDVLNHRFRIYESQHVPACRKCHYRKQMETMTISVHEWPLPEHTTAARAVVFELAVPPWFGHWRDATTFLRLDVLKAEYQPDTTPRSEHPLSADPHLAMSFFRPYQTAMRPRVGLLSENKPHVGTHRRGKKIATCAEGDVCIASGLRYAYFDSVRAVFVGEVQDRDEILRDCTYRVPRHSSVMGEFIFRPAQQPSGPTPNTVVARQSLCPEHMTLPEFKTLVSLPLGFAIQWWNIVGELGAPTVDFKKPETSAMIRQCILQAGPSDLSPPDLEGSRPSHRLLSEPRFAASLLDHLDAALNRVRTNWESVDALALFIAIAARVHTVGSTAIRDRCRAFLCEARDLAMRWTLHLRSKARAAGPGDRDDFLTRCTEAALVCGGTFDVDRDVLVKILDDDAAASVLLQCAITVQEGVRYITPATDEHVTFLHLRHRRLLRDAHEELAQKPRALDDAVRKSWSGYRPGAGWETVTQPGHWVVTRTALTSGRGMTVHLNLLAGQLLVNGLPLDRLPDRYERHPSYTTLFGKSTVEVMPTDVAGMQFSSKHEHHGYHLQFGLGPEEPPGVFDLRLRARDERAGDATYELIPARVFRGHLSDTFVDDFVHWYDFGSGRVEFRPSSAPWKAQSRLRWDLIRGDDLRWRLTRPGEEYFVVGACSPTARRLADILSPLAWALQIRTLLRPESSIVELDIPHLRLAFSVRQGEPVVRSREFAGTVIDTDQTVDTLIGLHSRLVLRNPLTHERAVLVLRGPISFASRTIRPPVPMGTRGASHVAVEVDRDLATGVLSFQIDGQIGRLVDNGHLHSKLVLAYLHALTSFCRPDPLTGLTGTEQALTILRSAAIRSFDRLTQAEVDVLHDIARVTPGRSFYPEHIRVMQVVSWSDRLSFLSQHPEFFRLVSSIYVQAHRCSFLHPSHKIVIPVLEDWMDLDLLDRARVRSSILWVSEFGAEDFTTQHDAVYQTRNSDGVTGSDIYRRAYAVSSKIHRRRTSLLSPVTTADELWTFLRACDTLAGPDETVDVAPIRYDGALFGRDAAVLAYQWVPLIRELATASAPRVGQVALMTWLSALACSKTIDPSIVDIVASFHTARVRLEVLPLSDRGRFRVSYGYDVSRAAVKGLLRPHLTPFQLCPEATWVRPTGEKTDQFALRTYQHFSSCGDEVVDELASRLLKQWPTASPDVPSDSERLSTYIDVLGATKAIRERFEACNRNLHLFRYLGRIEVGLRSLGVECISPPDQTQLAPRPSPRTGSFMSSASITTGPAPDLELTCFLRSLSPAQSEVFRDATRVQELTALLREESGDSKFEQRYACDLEQSIASLQSYKQLQPRDLPSHHELQTCLTACEHQVNRMEDALFNRDLPSSDVTTPKSNPLNAFRPRPRPSFFLGLLHHERWETLSEKWRDCAKRYAVALTMLQQARRMLNAEIRGDRGGLSAELQNVDYDCSRVQERPEWLLLEVEGNIRIRPVQSGIAERMIHPPNDRNASMQLNMGEGKSSTIVPLAACALADGSRLVRIIVAKPQSKQMAQMLVTKLGGLLNRRIHYIPFSRGLGIDVDGARTLWDLCRECQTTKGVLLVQPEHILSLQLLGLESYIAGRVSLGSLLVRTQNLFDDASRDIIDESDENFSTRYELIYTMGTQRAVEMSPGRWIYIQRLLDLLRDAAPSLAREYPQWMEVHTDAGSHAFPRIRVRDPRVERILVDRLGTRICEHGLPGLMVAHQPKRIRRAIHTYLTRTETDGREVGRIPAVILERFQADSDRTALLLLRGLLAGGVLGFALGRKRWRVNYGLDPSRTPATRLAVPYRAKDMPSPRSEFSHPDVVMFLTCLSHYYGGLDDEAIYAVFQHLMDTDQRDVEYGDWVSDAPGLDPCFRQLEGVNLRDGAQCASDVFPALRRSKPLIDYFLSHFVFPGEMKEFPSKLSASGWDLGKVKVQPTSAFSGTSDSRHLLPLDVTHLSLPAQDHTNALVLGYLLQPENFAIPIPATDNSIAQGLLDLVAGLPSATRVILDVGAQVLELTNLEVAQTWLRMYPSETARAAVFVSDGDELSVIDRSDHVEPLQTSPFAHQLDACLVFLDEAHTRGIDLRLPGDYRAAVTLGPGLTKDRLVQACMRLRKLGHGQSVVFCAPQEVCDQILERPGQPRHTTMAVADVLVWAMRETYADFRRNLPLWAVQGRRFVRQERLWSEARAEGPIQLSSEHAAKFMEAEAQSIASRYGPRDDTRHVEPRHAPGDRKMAAVQTRTETEGAESTRNSALCEEQERELSPETEQERQIERPPPALPAPHRLHDDVIAFAALGTVDQGSSAYQPAFRVLSNTSAARAFDVAQLLDGGQLWATMDFSRTVEASAREDWSDAFQRPVRWVLARTVPATRERVVDHAMIISPFEAQELLPQLQTGQSAVQLHLFKPCWNMDHAPFDDLHGFAVPHRETPPTLPSILATQLNLFAGRLYFRSVHDYERLCSFLGLAIGEAVGGPNTTADGFIPDKAQRPESCSTLTDNPVAFVRSVLQIRRDGLDYSKTHMGRLVGGDLDLSRRISEDTRRQGDEALEICFAE